METYKLKNDITVGVQTYTDGKPNQTIVAQTKKLLKGITVTGDVMKTGSGQEYLKVETNNGNIKTIFNVPLSELEKIDYEGLKFGSANTTTTDYMPSKTQVLLGIAGAIGGLYFAYKTKRSGWGYLGFFILGSIAGNALGYALNYATKKSDGTSYFPASGTNVPVENKANIRVGDKVYAKQSFSFYVQPSWVQKYFAANSFLGTVTSFTGNGASAIITLPNNEWIKVPVTNIKK